jgi:large subunit ribosomal protein L6
MSRIGKKIINVPAGVTVSLNGQEVTVKGPKGELKTVIHSCIKANLNGSEVTFEIINEKFKNAPAQWGTARANVNNLVVGVSEGFTRTLELNGVGYKMELGAKLTLFIGFSHQVIVEIPTGIKLELNKNVLTGTSADKHLLGDFMTKVHDMKPCEVYKHKGFKFPERFYRKKVAKKTK